MANIKSQIKRIKTSKKKHERNRAVKSSLKTSIAHFEKSLEKGQEEAKKALDVVVRALDKAASKGAIHKNSAANKKSALMKKYNTFIKEGAAPKAAEKKKAKTVKKKAKKPVAKKSTKKPAAKKPVSS